MRCDSNLLCTAVSALRLDSPPQHGHTVWSGETVLFAIENESMLRVQHVTTTSVEFYLAFLNEHARCLLPTFPVCNHGS